jgi:imidazolonepropionase-like amidohydrolase/ectoine hydroxylase-related dioxygenase (phytanoyl-CoA dioxygenase family)
MSPHADLPGELAVAVGAATAGAWRVTRAWSEGRQLRLEVDAGGPPPNAPLSLMLEVQAARPEVRAFRILGALAFSYRSNGRSLTRPQLGDLDRAVAALATLLERVAFDPSRDEVAPRNDQSSFPTPYHLHHLDTEHELSPDVVAAYRRDGHVLVRRALARDVVVAARPYLVEALKHAWPTDLPPVERRTDAYSQSFTQITDLWAEDPIVRNFSHARRIARMAAQLMGVEAVQCFCEDWLIKEPGARITPWHQDEAVMPFDTRATITCWIPLQDVRGGDGLLRFARGSHAIGVAPIEDISDESEAAFARIIAEHGFAIDELPAVGIGDVSFHDGKTIHGAFPNEGREPRFALALHCFAAGARFKVPTTPKMATLLACAAPTSKPGEPAVNDRWPLIYGASARPVSRRPMTRTNGPRFHLRATLLPGGEGPVDLWIEDGRLRFDKVEGAEELAPPGGFVTPGLVDSHAHISYPHERGAPVDTPAWMNARRAEYASTGVLALRDMGAVGDAISSLVDVPGLPRVHSAGNMILRQDEFPFTRTEPEELVFACVSRIARGARWTKIFADFSSDYQGRINSGFTERDDVTYAPDLLAEAVASVHALGGRAAAHAFTHKGAEVAIGAGVDSLEHGWGLDEELVKRMAERSIAWVPLVGIAPAMWRIARRDDQTERAAWIERTMDRLAVLLPLAARLGVRIFAGTDLFPEVTVGDEIVQLHELGLDRATAVAAGSWAARTWLDEPGLVEGAPADLVLYRSDPRADLAALFRPELILSGGERVAPTMAHVRPAHATWADRDRGLAW